jgi:hypothetical protein
MRFQEGAHAEQRVCVGIEALDPDGGAAPDARQGLGQSHPDVFVFGAFLDVAEDAVKETRLPVGIDVNPGSQVFVFIVRPLYRNDADVYRLAVVSKQRGESIDGPVRDIFEERYVYAVGSVYECQFLLRLVVQGSHARQYLAFDEL